MPATIKRRLQDRWISVLQAFGTHVWNYGTPVFERDWDVLVILDACRHDVMEEVAPSVEFLPDPPLDDVNSLGSMTREWMEKNFTAEYAAEMQRTAFVCANPHSHYAVDEEDWLTLVEPWRDGYSDDVGTVPPERVTDAAIRVADETDADRMIVHYMQPHAPFRSRPDLSPPELRSQSAADAEYRTVDDKLMDGDLAVETIWDAYRDNLGWALEHVETLLERVHADRAVISSDHGHTLGEYGCYAHPDYVPLPPLKSVPWIEVTAHGGEQRAVGNGRTEPQKDDELTTDEQVRAQLRSLGYEDPEPEDG